MAEVVYKQGIPDELKASLREANAWYNFSLDPCYAKLMARLDGMVLESYVALRGCQSSSDKVLANLSRRWQERRAISEALKGTVQTFLDERLRLLEELTEEPTDEQPQSDTGYFDQL